jgi:hypothetical protein
VISAFRFLFCGHCYARLSKFLVTILQDTILYFTSAATIRQLLEELLNGIKERKRLAMKIWKKLLPGEFQPAFSSSCYWTWNSSLTGTAETMKRDCRRERAAIDVNKRCVLTARTSVGENGETIWLLNKVRCTLVQELWNLVIFSRRICKWILHTFQTSQISLYVNYLQRNCLSFGMICNCRHCTLLYLRHSARHLEESLYTNTRE